MSARKTERKRSAPKKRGAAPREERGAGHALYVYCIGEAGALSILLQGKLPSAIEDDRPLESVGAGGLGAVVSRVPLNLYNEEALEAHLKDAAWMALRAMRHERVVDYFARRASVVPLRFGSIYLERSSVERMLGEKGPELRASLAQLEGREEWGVNVFCDRKALLEAILNLSPRLRELNEQARTATPGQAYLVRKKMDSMRAEEARAEIRRAVEGIEDELKRESVALARLRIIKDEAGEHGELVGKLACLVERASFNDFRGAAERLAAANMDAGFKLELTGPWPAYNFVSPTTLSQEQ
jgi:hypothetical protein